MGIINQENPIFVSLSNDEIYKYGLPLIYADLFKNKSEEEYLKSRQFLCCIGQKILGIFNLALSRHYYKRQKKDDPFRATEFTFMNSFTTKFVSLYSLASNDHFVSVNNGKKKRIEDVSSQILISRSLFEILSMHHFLFVSPKSDDEKRLLFDLWRISGINSMINIYQDFEDNKIDKDNAEIEKKSIIDSVKSNRLYSLNQNLIDRKFSSHSNDLFVFDDNRKMKKITMTESWEYLHLDKVFKREESKILYNYLCSNAHPTFSGLLQYEQQKNERRDLRTFPFFLSCVLLSLFIEDVLSANEDIKKYIYENYDTSDLEIYSSLLNYT